MGRIAQVEDWEKDPHMLENLKDHVPYLWKSPEDWAVELKRYPVEILVFANPLSGMYRMVFTKIGSTLFITGDVGEAAYRWGGAPDEIDMEWISRCDLGYFHSKCVASEVGREFVQWDEDRAKKRLEEQLQNMYGVEKPTEADAFEDEADAFEDEDDAPEYPEEYVEAKKKLEELGGYDALYNKDEWHLWLATHGFDVFDESFTDMGGVGTVTNLRCLYHLLGLKLAFARLKDKKVLQVLDYVDEEKKKEL